MGRKGSSPRPRGSTITFEQAVLAATANAAAESPRPFSGGSISPTTGRESISTTNGCQSVDEKQSQIGTRPAALSFSTLSRTLAESNAAGLATPRSPQARSDGRAVNSIPPFVVSLTEDNVDPNMPLLAPDSALIASHNYLPTDKPSTDSKSPPKDGAFPFPSQHSTKPREHHGQAPRRISRWATFVKIASPPPPHPNSSTEKIVPYSDLEAQTDYSQAWNVAPKTDEQSGYVAFQRAQVIWWRRSQHTLLRSPIIPLIFRLLVFTFSIIALGLGRSIHHLANVYHKQKGPSSMMAICIDAIALPYLMYITWDEYTGKPLGLRSARAKMRLIFLDMFFIVFDSANLALAFAGLSDTRSSCVTATVNQVENKRNGSICRLETALASVLLIALIAWLMTFGISVLRLVERIRN